jgi:hypothetical protein
MNSCQLYNKSVLLSIQGLGVVEGKQYPIFDYYSDPFDGQLLACIPASDNDVAACMIQTSGLVSTLLVEDPAVASIIPASSGPNIPDYFRYVVLDDPEGVMS